MIDSWGIRSWEIPHFATGTKGTSKGSHRVAEAAEMCEAEVGRCRDELGVMRKSVASRDRPFCLVGGTSVAECLVGRLNRVSRPTLRRPNGDQAQCVVSTKGRG